MTAPFAKLIALRELTEEEIRERFEAEIKAHSNFKSLDLAKHQDGTYFYGYLQTMYVWYRKGYEAGACRN